MFEYLSGLLFNIAVLWLIRRSEIVFILCVVYAAFARVLLLYTIYFSCHRHIYSSPTRPPVINIYLIFSLYHMRHYGDIIFPTLRLLFSLQPYVRTFPLVISFIYLCPWSGSVFQVLALCDFLKIARMAKIIQQRQRIV